MNKRKVLTAALMLCAACLWICVPADAAFNPEVEKAYNTAVQGQDALDGLDVKVTERTVSSLTNLVSPKEVSLQVSGIKSTALSANIRVSTDETAAESYYWNGTYYETTGEGNVKRSMDRETIWSMINSQIYLDMTSNYLRMLYAQEEDDGNVTFFFAATDDTLGDYRKKLLDPYLGADGSAVDSLQGTMRVDAEGHVLERSMQLIYTVNRGQETEETFMKWAEAVFSQNGAVAVSLPNLTSYKEIKPETPAVTITPAEGTVYTTADVNVRASGSLDAAVIGGFSRGSAVTRTGNTSDGWVQIQYNGMPGYVWGEYISETKPVYVTERSGLMYATTDVNIRADHNTSSEILGVLRRGASLEITGASDNGWTRVNYKGNTGYISSNYLSKSEPVADTYVQKASISGTVADASYGSLTLLADDGRTFLFNTVYAVMNMADTICTGDWITVEYTGSSDPYTASVVTDSVVHNDTAVNAWSVDGVVTAYNGNTLEMTCSDGVYRTFDLSGASVEVQGGIEPGLYLIVTWLSDDGEETRNIPAVAVA